MTDIEQRLIQAARAGEAVIRTGPDDVVRAGLIRELLLGRHGELDPIGVRLHGVRITGGLDLTLVKAVAGLYLSDCTTDEPIKARSASLPYLYFYGGRYAGLHADGLQVDGDLVFRDGTRVTGDATDSPIRLLGARVGGDLALTDTEIISTSGPALYADGLHVDGYVFFQEDVRITGQGELGAVNLLNAHVAANVELVETEISNDTGPAINANGVRVDGNVIVAGRNRFTGTSGVTFVNARISGQVALKEVEITGTAGIAVDMNGAQIDQSLFLRNGIVTGQNENGAVDLVSARIGRALELNDATVTNTTGAAINANRARVGGVVALLGRSRLSAGGDDPPLSLIGAHVTGSFGCADTVALNVGSDANPLLDLQDTTVGVSVRLPAALCPDRGRGGTCTHRKLVRLDDFGYAHLAPGWDWEQWLHLIRCHTPAYHASAYQKLAAVERAAGHDGTVRRILMAQQTDLRRRSPQSLGGPMTRWFHWLWGVLAGYGYRARRTAAALLLVLVTAGAIGWWAGQVPTRPGHLVAERVATAPVGAGAPCSAVELVGLGLDRGLPLAMTGMRARCDLDTASRRGQAFTAAIWVVQLAVWGLATLALAGYTNLVRKPG